MANVVLITGRVTEIRSEKEVIITDMATLRYQHMGKLAQSSSAKPFASLNNLGLWNGIYVSNANYTEETKFCTHLIF